MKRTPGKATKKTDAPAMKPAARGDGWASLLTGIGSMSRDKRQSSQFAPDVLVRQDQEALWQGDDIAAHIVEKVPFEMLREGFDIMIAPKGARTDAFPSAAPPAAPKPTPVLVPVDDGAADAEAMHNNIRDTELLRFIQTGLNYARAYGGGPVLIGAVDGNPPEMPLNEKSIRSFDWLTNLTPRECIAVGYYNDPSAPKYGEPQYYQIIPQQFVTANFVGSLPKSANPKTIGPIIVHESRIIPFMGVLVSRDQRIRNNGWGGSVLDRCYQVVRDFQAAYAGTSILLSDFAQAVIKFKGLMELIATNQEEVIQNRIKALDMGRSVARCLILDSEEEFERKATPMSGLADALDRLANRLAMVADEPVSILMGQEPGGLNATGDAMIRMWYDKIKRKQVHELEPHLRRILKLKFLAKNGPTKGREPANWSISWRPLWQPTEKEKAEAKWLLAQADNAYVLNGTLTPAEVAISRFGGDESDITLDFAGRVKLNAEYEKSQANAKVAADKATAAATVAPAA